MDEEYIVTPDQVDTSELTEFQKVFYKALVSNIMEILGFSLSPPLKADDQISFSE
jgi:hypothetical protein